MENSLVYFPNWVPGAKIKGRFWRVEGLIGEEVRFVKIYKIRLPAWVLIFINIFNPTCESYIFLGNTVVGKDIKIYIERPFYF